MGFERSQNLSDQIKDLHQLHLVASLEEQRLVSGFRDAFPRRPSNGDDDNLRAAFRLVGQAEVNQNREYQQKFRECMNKGAFITLTNLDDGFTQFVVAKMPEKLRHRVIDSEKNHRIGSHPCDCDKTNTRWQLQPIKGEGLCVSVTEITDLPS